MKGWLSTPKRRLRDKLLLSADDFDPELHAAGSKYLLVHNPGKVGSKSIALTLEHNIERARVFHTHSLTLKWLTLGEERMGRLPYPSFRPLEESWKVRHIFLGSRGTLHWKLFSAFRDPVARDISLFFAVIRHRHPADAFVSGRITEEQMRDELRTFLAGGTDLEYIAPQREWFTNELEGLFEMPVYEQPFNVERGWSKYVNRHGDSLVIMHTDRIDDVLADAALSMGLEVTEVHRTNEAHSKIGAGIPCYRHYDALRNAPALPAGYLDAQLESRFARHFFSEGQRDAIDRRWREFAS